MKNAFLEGGFDDGLPRDCSRKVKYEPEEDGHSYREGRVKDLGRQRLSHNFILYLHDVV